MNKTDLKTLRQNYGEKRIVRVQHLDARVPAWIIWTGIVLAALAALTEWTTLLDFQDYAHGVPYAFVQTVGHIILFWLLLRGMKTLPHSLTILWWVLIINTFLCLLGYMDLPNHAAARMERSVAGVLIFFSCIMAGILLIVWFEGRLRTLGILFLLEAMGTLPIPFLSLALFLDERCYYSNLITAPITLGLIWVAGKLLLGKPAASYQ